MKFQIVLDGESVVPDTDVTDVVAPTTLRTKCWQQMICMISDTGDLPKVRWWVTPTLDGKAGMTAEERTAFALGWAGRGLFTEHGSLTGAP